MPKGTRVSRCVDKVKKSGKRGVNPYAVCQASTDQSYATGRTLSERKAPAKRVNPGTGNSAGNPDSDEYVSGGRTGKPTIQGRLLKRGTKKGSSSADPRVSAYTAGPAYGQLRRISASIEYKRMGILIAEAMGYRVDEIIGLALAGVGKAVSTGVKTVGKVAGKVAKTGAKIVKRGVKVAGKAVHSVTDPTSKRKLRPEEPVEEPVEEAAPLVAAGVRAIAPTLLRRGAVAGARRAAPGSAKRVIAKGAKRVAKNRPAMAALGDFIGDKVSSEPVEDETQMNKYVKRLLESPYVGHRDPKTAKLTGEFAGHTATQAGGKRRGIKGIRSKTIRRGAAKALKRLGQKLQTRKHGLKINPKSKHLAQLAIDRYRRSTHRATPETADIRKADTKADIKKRAGDQ